MFCHDGDEGVQNPLATNRDQPHTGHGMNADNCYDCLTRLNFLLVCRLRLLNQLLIGLA